MEIKDDINHINTNKEYAIDKKFIRQLLYNNIIKSSKKLKTNLSMIPTKFNIKPKNEMSLNNNKKTIKEKIPISSENKIVRKKINKNTKKSKIEISNYNSNSKAKVNKTYQNNLSIQQSNNTITNKKKLIPSGRYCATIVTAWPAFFKAAAACSWLAVLRSTLFTCKSNQILNLKENHHIN